MKLLIRQRVFSWSDTYDVYDETGSPKYYVKAEVWTLGHRIHVYEHGTGEEVGLIQERLLTMMPKFEISARGRSLGRVDKRFTLFRPRYEVDYLNWQVEGDFFGLGLSGDVPRRHSNDHFQRALPLGRYLRAGIRGPDPGAGRSFAGHCHRCGQL